MNNIKIKVCGMRDQENILEVARLRPDYMGFIFYDKTPRYVGADFMIPKDFPASTKRVGVFVNESVEEILKKVAAFNLDFVQLHGNETVAACAELKECGVGVIKVFSVDDEMDFSITEAYEQVVDFFLFDTRGKLYGGNAMTFDWNVLTRYNQKIPFFLSGGITPDNVEDVKPVAALNLRAIDVNSGVELQPALKDVQKIKTIQSILHSKLR